MTCDVGSCGGFLIEDRQFASDAAQAGIIVRRFRCVAGHSHYEPPDVEGRGWHPRPPRARGLHACARCGETIQPGDRASARAKLCRRCLGPQSAP